MSAGPDTRTDDGRGDGDLPEEAAVVCGRVAVGCVE